jgi:hypothetical protein
MGTPALEVGKNQFRDSSSNGDKARELDVLLFRYLPSFHRQAFRPLRELFLCRGRRSGSIAVRI